MYHCHYKEDEILDNLIGHIPNGFYIDVGAHHPTLESITKVFYDKGWNGINIEPQDIYHLLLCIDRPRDINLKFAIGDKSGDLELFLQDGCTTAISNYANASCARVTVPMRTLTQVLDMYAPTDKDLNFLKVDVEGYELQVLQGLDFDKYRPEILCIESTVPNTRIPAYAEWDKFLEDKGYIFIEENEYNRYYRSHTENLLGDSW